MITCAGHDIMMLSCHHHHCLPPSWHHIIITMTSASPPALPSPRAACACPTHPASGAQLCHITHQGLLKMMTDYYDCDDDNDDDDQRCSSREESVCPTNPIDNGNTMQVIPTPLPSKPSSPWSQTKGSPFLNPAMQIPRQLNRWARTNPSPQNPTKTTMFRFSLRFAFWKFLLRDASLTLMTPNNHLSRPPGLWPGFRWTNTGSRWENMESYHVSLSRRYPCLSSLYKC